MFSCFGSFKDFTAHGGRFCSLRVIRNSKNRVYTKWKFKYLNLLKYCSRGENEIKQTKMIR